MARRENLADRATFEVRCPRCDVTFAAGTRTCVHCSGRTTKSSAVAIDYLGSGAESGAGLAGVFGRSPGKAGDRSPEEPEFELREVATDDRVDDEMLDPEMAPSPGRSLLGSLGSLIWVAMLIAFSLSGRTCGE